VSEATERDGITPVLQSSLFGLEQAQMTSDDYYTPSWVFDRLGLVFDIDVCSPPGGLPYIPARRHFTMADDGLSQPWSGRVWMNPPYSDAEPWVDRFIAHRHGVALLPVVKSFWRLKLWAEADAIGDLADVDRIKFMRNGKPTEIMFPTFFAAFGDECVDALNRVGVARRRAS
jgi:hypothetical protein